MKPIASVTNRLTLNHSRLYNDYKSPIGIIGGVGPHAHIDFERYLLGQEACDQDYPSYVLVNASYVADRTQAYLAKQYGETLLADPFLGLQSAVITLLRAGCEKICIVCNTAHLWLPELQAAFPMVEFISIIETSIQAIQARQIKEVILLATTGTIQSELYGKALEAAGIRVHLPNSEQQATIDQGIYGDPAHGLGGVKTGDVLAGRLAFEGVAWEILQSLARERNQPIETLLTQGQIGLGFFCTEIGVAVTDQTLLKIAIDSTKELAIAMRKIAKQSIQ